MSEMLRFQRLIREIRPVGEALTDNHITLLLNQLDASDVAAIVSWMDRLAAEKAALPDWDGDSSDDISKAQRDLARLVVRLRVRFDAAVDGALLGAHADTVQWVHLADGRDQTPRSRMSKWLRRLFGRRS